MNPTLEAEKTTEKYECLLSPEQATGLAEKTQRKITFLETVGERILNQEELTHEEQEEKQELFGDKKFKEELMGWYISDLQHEYYQFATAGIDGAKHIEVGFPTALNHKESDFEKFMKEHQAGIKELYHYAGTTIDHATENIVKDYNRHATPENQINWETPEPHARRWFSPRFIEDGTTKGLEFTFGGTEYRLVKGNNGNWYASLQKSGVFLGAKVVEKELTELEYRIADLLQEAANNILK